MNVNSQDNTGGTALHAAALSGHLNCLRILLQVGVGEHSSYYIPWNVCLAWRFTLTGRPLSLLPGLSCVCFEKRADHLKQQGNNNLAITAWVVRMLGCSYASTGSRDYDG